MVDPVTRPVAGVAAHRMGCHSFATICLGFAISRSRGGPLWAFS